MKPNTENFSRWWGRANSGLVLVAGVFADNALSAIAHTSLLAPIFTVVCGLVVGALTVLTYTQRANVYFASVAFFSALTVIVITVALPHVEHTVTVALCLGAIVGCSILPLLRLSARRGIPMPIHVKTHDEHR